MCDPTINFRLNATPFATLLRAGTLGGAILKNLWKRAERIFQVILVISGIIGFFYGYATESMQVTDCLFAASSGPTDHWEDAPHLICKVRASSWWSLSLCSGIRTPLYNITFVLELNDRSRWWIGTFFIDHSIPLAISSTTGTVQSISDKS